MARIEDVIGRAAKDKGFRERLLADAGGALAAESLSLAADERAMLDEYVRVARGMSAAELDEAIADYLADASGGKRAAGVAGV